MYKITFSNGVYYLQHEETKVFASLDKDQFMQKLAKYFNPTLDMADKISFSLFIGDYASATELINL